MVSTLRTADETDTAAPMGVFLKFAIDEVDGTGVKVLRPEGRLDSYNNDLFEETIESLLIDVPALLVLDLSKVSFINSTVLGTIVAAHVRAGKDGGSFAIFGANPKVDLIFRITKVDSALALFETFEEALAALTS